MADQDSTFLALATTSRVVRTAVRISIIVGTILVLINHGSVVVSMSFSAENLVQMLLTYLVPYCVSTYSSVRAIQDQIRTRG